MRMLFSSIIKIIIVVLFISAGGPVAAKEPAVSQFGTLAQTSAGAQLSGSFDRSQGTETSPLYAFDEPMASVAGYWTRTASVSVRYGQSPDSLGSWQDIAVLEDDLPDKPGIHQFYDMGNVLPLGGARYFQYRVGARSMQENVQVYFDFYRLAPARQRAARIAADSVGLGPTIVSRSGWGANEAQMTWPSEYAEVKAIVIHHTAADDSRVVNIDGREAVRNIYQGHAVTYGWGDIGYNYVMDLSGSIYEGRSGGNGVIGGHTLGYNSGLIGISVVGNYDQRNVEMAQQDSLVDLIAYLAYKNRLDPLGTTTLKNKTIPVIIGHQDLNATSCPGNTLYGRLGDLRSKVAAKLATYTPTQYSAQVQSIDTQANVFVGQKKKLRITVRNTGNNALLAYGQHAVKFVAQDGASLSPVVVPFGSAIEAGAARTVELEIVAPSAAGTYALSGALYAGGMLLGTISPVSVQVTVPDYAAQIVATSQKTMIQSGQIQSAWMEVRNIGQKTWDGTENISLVAIGAATDWYTSGDWVSTQVVGGFDQYPIAPGGIGRISFQIKAPTQAGVHVRKFTLQSGRSLEGGPYETSYSIDVEGSAPVQDAPAPVPAPTPVVAPAPTPATPPAPAGTDVPTRYDAKLIEQSPYITTSPGLPATLRIIFKNTGNTTWQKDVVRLGTVGPQDRKSPFYTVGWLSENRISFQENSVAPGATATFVIPLKTTLDHGVYKEGFGLVAEGQAWFGTPGVFWNITLKPTFDAFGYVSQSPHQTIVAGQSAQVYLEVKNTGSAVWQKGSNTPLRLATSSPRDRQSRFLAKNRIEMSRDVVAPGETVRFSFDITAPNDAGVYKEYFALVKDGSAWLPDIGIFFQWTVVPNLVTANPTPASVIPAAPTPSLERSVQVSAVGGPYLIARGSGQEIARGEAGEVIEVGYTGGVYTVKANGKTYTATEHVRIVPWSPQTYLALPQYEDRPAWNRALNDNTFKGVVEVRYAPKTRKLWAINELNIEDYLKGVSESIDTFDFEYLKVSAIIQRSYVLHHYRLGGRHKDDFLTLKNSRNGNGDDQIYQGYNFTQRASNISRAVDATRGEIVTYQGRPVITPYYTQSDGRTRSASEVWNFKQSDYPWLVSMPDPGSQGLALMGHGVGLPGRGARDLVKQGKTYKEVLQYFYQGTDTATAGDAGANVRVGIYSISY